MQYRKPLTLALCAVATSAALADAAKDPAWVDQRVREWQPTPRERRWESIGWAQDLRSAEKLAREHRRPVFLFTLDGRMGVGRC
jgi:hypothetical protein